MCKKYVNSVFRLFVGLIVILSCSVWDAKAQMFSVGGDQVERAVRLTPGNMFYLGFEPTKFMYRGGSDVPPSQNPGSFEFSGPIMRLKYETLGLSLHIGAGGGLTGLDEVGYFDAGLRLYQGLNLYRSRNFSVLVPLQIKSGITSVNNNQALNTQSQFRLGSITFGGGGYVETRLSDHVRLGLAAVPALGFSFSTGNTFSGSMFELDTEARLYLDRLFGEVGLSFGWDYGFRKFDVDENQFDYNLRAHSILVGITF